MTEPDKLLSIETSAGVCDENGGEWKWLACPQCAASLREHGKHLRCAQCAREWPIKDGVPHFVEQFPYWGEIPLEEMREVNRLAALGDWKSPLLNSTNPIVRKASEMILNLDRANWQWLVNLSADSRVLDLGAGMGTNSQALGAHYREVVAVEPVLERVQFMQQRFAQEKLAGVKVVRSSVWDIPFPGESFDLVAMNGVLEWVAEGKDGEPARLQEQALKKIFNIVRPGGYFYLGIENRLGYGYFFGYPDPHCGLPFVTILPRPLAHWYAKRRGHSGGYRNYLYSSHGYRKLLSKAGFSQVEIYVALPSYNHPRFLIPIDGGAFSYFSRNFNAVQGGRLRRVLHGLLLRLGILKYCEFSFVILARK
jgi:SAM-dependent methyltransferase